MPRLGTRLRGLAPDIALTLVALGCVALLAVARTPEPGFWTALAWGQYLLVAVLLVLIARAGGGEADRRPARAALLAGGMIAVVALSLAVHRHDPWFWDAATTWARATIVREGGDLFGVRQRVSLFYPFVALLQAVSAGSAAVVRLGAAAVGTAGLIGVGVLAGRHGGRTAGLAAGVLACSTPALFCLLHWLYIDMFLLAVCVAWLLACDQQAQRPGAVRLVGCVVLAVAALFTKEYAVVVLPVALGLWWVRGRAIRPAARTGAGARWRKLVVPMVIIGALGFGWGLWRFYLNFWRGLFQQGEPSWEYWPLLIIPGNPHIAAADQLRLAADLVRQHLAQAAGSGLLGFALLGLVEVAPRRRPATWAMLAGAGVLAVWPLVQLEPTHLNALWRWGPGLDHVAPAVAVALVVLRVAGWVRLGVTRWQVLMLAGVAANILFFACVAKVTRIDGRLAAFLDWRYLLFSNVFLAVLAGEFVARHLAVGRASGRAGLALAALAPALLVSGNLVAVTDYMRQVASFTGDQLQGVRAAIAQARARGVPVLTTWPYYYPEVPRSLDYGPFPWATEGVALGFLAFHDATEASDRIALFDSRTGSGHLPLAEREGVVRFRTEAPYIPPLRPGIRMLPAPAVCVVDLAAPLLMPPFAPRTEEFAAAPDPADRDGWAGLGGCEVWDEGLTMRWSVADEVRLTLGPAAGETFRLELRARAFAGVPDQTVTLRVNGADLGALPVPPRWTELVWTIPGRLVHGAAPNELVFATRATASPAEGGDGSSTDRRRLGIGLDRLRITVAPASD